MPRQLVVFTVTLVVMLVTPVTVALAIDPANQTPDLLFDEAQTVYYGNLARRNQHLPPLRWNRQLTHAARWFAWDSVENRSAPYCGHQDTNGQWPSDRAPLFGYLGRSGAENAICGYATPQAAINGWLNSPGHRANLLNADHREIGLGYYRRQSDGRGYIAQKFGNDPVYAPVVIEHEAPNTLNPDVALYIYQREAKSSFAALGPATEMMISTNSCFSGASWQPFATETRVRLPEGEGWRTVYVKTRDAAGATQVVSDTIYLGSQFPITELSATLSDRQPAVTLTGLAHPAFSQVQFSLGWLVDETFSTFRLLWGTGERVADPMAWGGHAFRLGLDNMESSAWVFEYRPVTFADQPLVAYIRLKVTDNTSSAEVARFSVRGGEEYGLLRLRGSDFTAAGQYQEFALPFTYRRGDDFLIFQFWRSGNTEVFIDAVTIFTAPQPISDPLTFAVPGGNYRGQGVWVRYTDGTAFTALEEASARYSFRQQIVLAQRNAELPAPLTFAHSCAQPNWYVAQAAPWLTGTSDHGMVHVSVDQQGLTNGVYDGTIIFAAPDNDFRLTVPVRLLVVDRLYASFMPLVGR
ncbi:CAP domain-containing protein [Chloroflexus sp.]|uniref:CAP domain-containing protein n=1 Tax=Chloroflexus sp. TaxID=1904827 RepID=UPI0026151B58|nr:CAP domain-containing protein [uncultured Chloroflexus sp.]